MRSAPQSWLCAAISLIKAIVSGESFGFLTHALDLCFGEHAEELTMPAQKCFWLDKEERLFPGPSHPGQEHQKMPIWFPADGTFDLSTQDDQLLPQQRVFRQQFGFASGQIGERAKQKGSRRRFDPKRNTFLERMRAETDALLKQGKYIQHE